VFIYDEQEKSKSKCNYTIFNKVQTNFGVIKNKY